MSLTFCKLITIPLLVCLTSAVVFVAPVRAEVVILAGVSADMLIRFNSGTTISCV